MWELNSGPQQNGIIRNALNKCSFPFERMSDSLAKEGKTNISVTWADLTRYTQQLAQKHVADHTHFHDGEATVSPVIREIEGRRRVLGLFYLPPYTKIVLDDSLVHDPVLAEEVFLAEAAHAVDYHYMNNDMRRAVWDALHDTDLPEGTNIPESGDIDHGHSWFDGPQGYNTWVGEAFMEAFTASYAPTVKTTIHLSHPVTAQAANEIREALTPTPIPPPSIGDDTELREALERFLTTKRVPGYLRDAAEKWLNAT